jgi:23S rRNA pseudouridine1911/1915/1917 synthase
MKKILIKKENIGMRIDKFLSQEFFIYTRGEIIRSIKDGKVLINTQKIKPSYILKIDDEITIVNFAEKNKKIIPNKKIVLEIVFKNEDIVIINKQAGIKVHPSDFAETETLVNGLLAGFPEIENVNDGSVGSGLRPGIVHRLDKDTSGLMVVARNQQTFDELKRLFKNRLIEKKYVAICEGVFDKKQGTIEKAIARAANYRKQIVAKKNTHTKIRPAVTEYKILAEKNNYSVVEIVLKTGRTHQIRVHMASVGHSVIGDTLYGGKNQKIKYKKVSRQLLHSKDLEFELWNKKYLFSTPLPLDMKIFSN